jgi:hypothetical protein
MISGICFSKGKLTNMMASMELVSVIVFNSVRTVFAY